MANITHQEITDYIESNLQLFHQRKLKNLQRLKLRTILKDNSPYIFRIRNSNSAPVFLESILESQLYTKEKQLYDGILRELAIFICSQVYSGKESSFDGIDLEFERDEVIYIISVISDPNLSNRRQKTELHDYFSKAKEFLKTNTPTAEVITISGCCYGKDSTENKDDYTILCGQKFWELISGDENFYFDTIVPFGLKATDRHILFLEEYTRILNKLTFEFISLFCDTNGKILWEEIIKFNSSNNNS